MRFVFTLTVALLVTGCSTLSFGGGPTPAPTPVSEARAQPGPDRSGGRARPYDEVIPEGVVTDSGLFVTHRVDDELFFEIPPDALGKELLLITTLAENTDGKFGSLPLSDRVLRWERRGDRILLRSPSYDIVADSSLPISHAVEKTTYAPIVAVFDVEAWGPDSSAVIDVTSLYTSGVAEFDPQKSGRLEQDRTFIEEVAAFPSNVEVSAVHTYTVVPPSSGRFSPSPYTESVVVHWSMVELPETPMEPRRYDSRIGYFTVEKTDYSTDDHHVTRYQYITRWRLECREGEAVPCEPVEPIVFHIDPATPEKWIPYIKAGIEEWQEAFEEAGFRNAILAKDMPSDRDWSPQDARYSIVHWTPSATENAVGPHIHDPRTGEILVSDIMVFHNIMNLLRKWYFTQVAPLDERAQRLPFPDELMGRLIQFVVEHEVGHALGLEHNMKASSMYPVDSIRNEDFLRRMGHVPSVMDYSRFNYVVQPEDSIPPELLTPSVGPYDRFAIRWGYRPLPDVKSADEARSVLDEWAREQEEKPWLRYSTSEGSGVVAGELAEAVGDADPVYATRLGLKNIRRTVPLLIPATVREGEDYSDLKELYDRLVQQWGTELGHVASVIGGVEGQQRFSVEDDGTRFAPLPAQEQREAVAFLNEEAFQTPHFLLDAQILRRIEPFGALDRIASAQHRLLNQVVFYAGKLQVLLEAELLAEQGEDVYTLSELLQDLRAGIWSELHEERVEIDLGRRNMQLIYLDVYDAKIHSDELPDYLRPPADSRSRFRQELIDLDEELRVAHGRAADEATRAHLRAARDRIEQILSP